MLGGITPPPMPPELPLGRLTDPSPDPPILPKDPDTRPMPVEFVDIPSDVDDRLNDDRTVPPDIDDRGRNARLLPPPIREGMKPSDMPP